MKHYYDDDGCLNYEPSSKIRLLLFKFTPLATDGCDPIDHHMHVRTMACECASKLILEYDFCKDLGSMGNGDTVEEWREKKECSPFRTALKKLMFEFIDEGYVPKEFLLVAWNTMCSIQFDQVVGI